MNASFGDIFNDGRLSIYKTNISEPGVLVQGNNLWVPKKHGEPGRSLELRESRVEPGRRSRRLELGRAVRRSEQRRHARPVSGQRLRLGGRAHAATGTTSREIAVGHSAIIGDAQNWPAMKRPEPVRLSAQARVAERRRRPVHRVAQVVGATDTYDGRAVALADLSQPRRARRRRRQPARPAAGLPEHACSPGRHWIEFELEGTREQPQRDRRAGRSCTGTASEQVQEVSGGSGFSAQNQRRLHYGLGHGAAVDRVVDPLAVGPAADDRASGRRHSCIASRSRNERLTPTRRRRPARRAAATVAARSTTGSCRRC